MIFQVTNTQGTRITFNANHVIAVAEVPGGCEIIDSTGNSVMVQESYRSVRGYVKKAYATATTSVAENEEE